MSGDPREVPPKVPVTVEEQARFLVARTEIWWEELANVFHEHGPWAYLDRQTIRNELRIAAFDIARDELHSILGRFGPLAFRVALAVEGVDRLGGEVAYSVPAPGGPP